MMEMLKMNPKDLLTLFWNELKGDMPYFLSGISFVLSINIVRDALQGNVNMLATGGLLIVTTLFMAFLTLPKDSS